MQRPDYQGGSIVNLMSSIIEARGGASIYPALRVLPAGEMADVSNIILLVIDGLGAGYLSRRSPQGILSRHLRGPITSVFPPTTAAAIPTFLTGDAPRQHGLTGWHTYLRELGCVMTVLPGRPRYGGAGYRAAGIDPVRLFNHRPIFDRIETKGYMVSPAHIARSDFNLAHIGQGTVVDFRDLAEMFHRTARILRVNREPKYLYLYWPQLDEIGHMRGMDSTAAYAHLREIEQALTDFLVSAAGTDTLVLVTADHGQIDTIDRDCIDLSDHPDLEDCLVLPLCGEPRAAFCYVRPDKATRFETYCRQELFEALRLHRSIDLIEEGLFGSGPTHPALADRVGDYTLLMREHYVIRQWLPFEQRYMQVGVHGGLSETELTVPLSVLRA